MWDHSQRKWSKHECLLCVRNVAICAFKDAIFFNAFQQTGLFLIYKEEIVVHIWSHAGLHSTVTALENGLPKNKVKNFVLQTNRDAHKTHTWT